MVTPNKEETIIDHKNDSHVEIDDEQMEFNPVLFLRGNELPAGTTKLQIVSKLENVYGHKSGFHVFDFPHNSLYVIFPNKTLAKNAFKDGLDFGQNNVVTFYDIHNYGIWLQEQ